MESRTHTRMYHFVSICFVRMLSRSLATGGNLQACRDNIHAHQSQPYCLLVPFGHGHRLTMDVSADIGRVGRQELRHGKVVSLVQLAEIDWDHESEGEM